MTKYIVMSLVALVLGIIGYAIFIGFERMEISGWCGVGAYVLALGLIYFRWICNAGEQAHKEGY